MQRGVLLSVDRRFARTSHIRFLTFVYNSAPAPAGTPDVALQVQIFRDDQPVFTAPLSKLRADAGADFARLPYMAELSLSTFPPGRYVLQITAIDRAAKTSVRCETLVLAARSALILNPLWRSACLRSSPSSISRVTL